MVEERSFEVGLDDVGAGTAVGVGFFLFDLLLDFVEILAILDVSTAVTQLSWFDYPPIVPFLASLVELT